MQKTTAITTLFLDVGGVLLTNGWDRHARALAARTFDLNLKEMDDRHRLTFDTYEVGKLTLDDYLSRTIFYTERPFTRHQFREFMYAQSLPHADMIALVRQLKAKYQLKIAVVNNEGRELNDHRIRHFNLNEFVDFFISSCFVHFRKPDVDIFRVALDIAHAKPQEVVYIDDRSMFVEVAQSLGILGVKHKDYLSTRGQLAEFGLRTDAE